MNALVVDDSSTVRLILKKILTGLGWDVTLAKNGLDALQVIQTAPEPQLALIDWNMPEMDGFALVCALRADHRWDDLRLMMVTTETEMSQMARALKAGADEYVMKPFTADVIADKLSLLGLDGPDEADGGYGADGEYGADGGYGS